MTRPAKVYRPAVETSAWCGRVGAGICGVYRTQQTQLTTSSKLPLSAACCVMSVDSFSAPPFTAAEGRTKSCLGSGFEDRRTRHHAGQRVVRWPRGACGGRARRPGGGEGLRALIVQRAMRSHLVIVFAPPLELLAHIGEGEEYLHVQTLIAQAPVE